MASDVDPAHDPQCVAIAVEDDTGLDVVVNRAHKELRATPTHDCTVTGETTGFAAYVDSLQAETIRRQLPTARR